MELFVNKAADSEFLTKHIVDPLSLIKALHAEEHFGKKLKPTFLHPCSFVGNFLLLCLCWLGSTYFVELLPLTVDQPNKVEPSKPGPTPKIVLVMVRNSAGEHC